MGHCQGTTDTSTDPLIVVTEDGSRWINVEDIVETKWLIKENPHLLGAICIHKSDTNKELTIEDDLDVLLYPETEAISSCSSLDKILKKNLPLLCDSVSAPNKAKQVYRVVSAIINRLRRIKEQLGKIQSTDSDRYSIHRDRGVVAKNSDGSKWYSVKDASDIERSIQDSSKSKSSTTDVSVGNITKLQVVAEKMARNKNDNFRYVKEKIVCAEYDVYTKDTEKPKKLRAYLALQTSGPKSKNQQSTRLEANSDGHMALTDDEIKLIDAEIKEKKGYLDELRDNLRNDRLQKKHDRAVSTQKCCMHDEVIINKRKATNPSLDYVNQNTSKKENDLKSTVTPKKTANQIDVKQTSVTKYDSDLLNFGKEICNQKIRDTLKRYSETDNYCSSVLNAKSKLDQIKELLLKKTTLRNKYLQYMRNLKESDRFNENMTSVCVNVC